MTDEAPKTASLDDRAFLLGVQAVRRMLGILREDAERLAMPPAVLKGLTWIRDDAEGVLADATAFVKQKEG